MSERFGLATEICKMFWWRSPGRLRAARITLALELEMNGVPHMLVMRSISLYGLSDVILTFEDRTDDYFARQIVFERLARATLPTGVTPSLSPLFSPSGLVYRYVLESPDRTPQELKTIE